MRDALHMDKVPTTSGVDIRQPSTAVFGVSSADRFLLRNLLADYVPYPEWDVATTYAIGDKVRLGDLFYESLVNANLGNQPDLTLATDWEYTDGPLSYVSRPGKETPFQFTLQSNQNFLGGYFTRLALTEMNYTWAIPTITERNNRIGIKYKVGAGATQSGIVDVDPGWYTLRELAAQLQTKVIAKAAPNLNALTITSNPNTGSLIVNTNTAGTLFAFVPVDPIINGAGTNPFTKTQPDRIQLYDMLNFPSNVGTTAANYTLAQVQVSGVVSLLSTKFIDIVCEKLTGYQATRDGDTGARPRDILARLYLTTNTQPTTNQFVDFTNDVPEGNPAASLGSAPFSVYKEFGFPKQIAWDPTAPVPGNLVFSLYDDQGYPLSTLQTSATNAIYDDKNQPDWTFTLLASEI